MKLDRYVLKELAVPFFIGTFVVAFLFLANEFIAIFKGLDIRELPLSALLQLAFLKMPQWLNLTLPVGVALGSSLALSRLARDSEVTAMRAAGIPARRLLLPVAAVGVGAALFNFWIVAEVMPPAMQRYRELAQEAHIAALAPTFQNDVFIRLDKYNAYFGTVERSGEAILLTEILLIERPRPGEFWIISADTGRYEDGVWTIRNGVFRTIKDNRLVQFSPREGFTIEQEIRIPDLFMTPAPDEETLDALRAAIEQGRKQGRDTTALEVAYHVKFSVPASCIIFAITGSLFALTFARWGPFTGVLLSLGLVILYYNVHVISTEIIGKNGWVPPMWAAWLPNLIYLAAGMVLLWRIE